MANNEPAIVARGLTKRFGDFTAVDGIDLEIRRGEIFGLLGPNGAGKTTTIRMMLGLLEPTSGTISVLGVPVNERAAEIRSRIGYMAQSFSLYDDLTVLQNLRFYGRAYGIRKGELRTRIEAALQRTDLEGRGSVTTKALSGGWRQRLALSAAILHRPELIFLDEPTAGVDPASRRAFWDLLYELVTEGITVLVTTHYMEEAEHCHRLAFVQRGRAIAQGTPRAIKQEKMIGQVIEITCDQPNRALAVLQGQPELDEVAPYGAKLHVIAGESSQVEARIAALLEQAGITVEEIEVVEPTLEDVFITQMKAHSG
jgi:ABC-2 type transport system ATP-binding protein